MYHLGIGDSSVEYCIEYKDVLEQFLKRLNPKVFSAPIKNKLKVIAHRLCVL